MLTMMLTTMVMILIMMNNFYDNDDYMVDSEPSSAPSSVPSAIPSVAPSDGPTSSPSAEPSSAPSSAPSVGPTGAPTTGPTSFSDIHEDCSDGFYEYGDCGSVIWVCTTVEKDVCGICDVACDYVQLNLTTYMYPYETVFSLINAQTDAIVWKVSGLSDLYATTTYISLVCPAECYRVLIEDSVGDGISDGEYSLYFGGQEIQSGSDFGCSSWAFVGDN